jgi:hypothetical protein
MNKIIKEISGFKLNLSDDASNVEASKIIEMNFSIVKDEKWDNWGNITTVFYAFKEKKFFTNENEIGYRYVKTNEREIYQGHIGFNDIDEVIWVSAESAIYKDVRDSISLDNIAFLEII